MYEGYGGKPSDSTGDDANDGCDLEALATEFVSELPDKKLSSAASKDISSKNRIQEKQYEAYQAG